MVRDAEELHDTLLTVGALSAVKWRVAHFLRRLVAQGRAASCQITDGPLLWIAAENWPVVRAALAVSAVTPAISLPERLDRAVESDEAIKTLVRGRVEISGPTTAGRIAGQLGLDAAAVDRTLLQLEAEGCVLRGRFTHETDGTEWCERRLLARIHRRTLDGLRRQIQPVDTDAFFRFLLATMESETTHSRSAAFVCRM